MLNQPVISLKGVGKRLAERLARLDIHCVQDLLFHLPLRYQDRTQSTAIGALLAEQEAVIEADILLAEALPGRRKMWLYHVSDGSGTLRLRFFHQGRKMVSQLAVGTRVRCFGAVKALGASMEMVHPEYQCLDALGLPPREQRLTPIYPATEGLGQTRLRRLIEQVLVVLAPLSADNGMLPDVLADSALPAADWPPLLTALQCVHAPLPKDHEALSRWQHGAQQRLIFEEFLAHHLSMALVRRQRQAHAAPALCATTSRQHTFLQTLPFALTTAQHRVVKEIGHDLSQPYPMQRLLQGDVGCGKTVVAVLAALQAVEAGFQVAIMAPTELLAEQHYRLMQQGLESQGLVVGWLSGSLPQKQREPLLQELVEGRIHILVGTHALIQDSVCFKQLGLVIIDEQHRFGVHQRLLLNQKGTDTVPHQLVMTATPIPRSLYMTLYADLDCSVIDELPPGRSPITTLVLPDERRMTLVERVKMACNQGSQCYWVCPLIEESEKLQCEAAEKTHLFLSGALGGLAVGLLHGRMKNREKEHIMAQFKADRLSVLVATTVIEVGVDVPNASLMVIENAERLGLAQLHQLRGRVGRGQTESSCVLMYKSPLGKVARQRLEIIRGTQDGFKIAQEDLELRGPGAVLGTRQSGEINFRVANLLRDQALIPQVAPFAQGFSRQYPEREAVLVKRWLGPQLAVAQA